MHTWLFTLGQLCSGNLPPELHYVHLGNPCEIAHMSNLLFWMFNVVKWRLIGKKKSMLKVNLKTCPQPEPKVIQAYFV